MAKTRLPLAVLALALAAVPSRAAEVDRLLPDDTEVVLGFNVRQVLDAPLVRTHALDLLRNYVRSSADAQKVLDALGFDPFKDLHTLTAASPGASDNGKGLAILRGRFDVARFRAKAAEVTKERADHLKAADLDGQTVYEITGVALNADRSLFVALLDDTTLVAAGDRAYLSEAIAKAAGRRKPAVKREVAEGVARANPAHGVWIVAQGSALAAAGLTHDERAKKGLEKLLSLTGGIAIADGIRLDFTVLARTAEDAAELGKELQDGLAQAKGLIELLAGNDAKLSPLVQVFDKIKTTVTGTAVNVNGELPAALLEKLLKGSGS